MLGLDEAICCIINTPYNTSLLVELFLFVPWLHETSPMVASRGLGYMVVVMLDMNYSILILLARSIVVPKGHITTWVTRDILEGSVHPSKVGHMGMVVTTTISGVPAKGGRLIVSPPLCELIIKGHFC